MTFPVPVSVEFQCALIILAGNSANAYLANVVVIVPTFHKRCNAHAYYSGDDAPQGRQPITELRFCEKETCTPLDFAGRISRNTTLNVDIGIRSSAMNTSQPGSNSPIQPQPARDMAPRRLIVTASVVTFAIRDWSLWVLLRDGPCGPPMRLVLGTEALTDARA